MFAPFAPSVKAQQTSMTNNTQKPENGLQFRLSEGTAGAEKREAGKPADAKTLAENDSQNLLKRLPEIKKDADDAKDFAVREGSLPAPKTGKIINQKFPADTSQSPPNINQNKVINAPNALEVVRFAPEGAVGTTPEITVSFNAPMIAVQTQEEAAQNVPVQMSPQAKGKWRWLDTRTLVFDVEGRLPMATLYTLTVPAGTKSANGAVLAKNFSWTFSTSAPKVQTFVPNGEIVRPNTLMFAEFDQQINPADIAAKTVIKANGKLFAARLATAEEIAADENLANYGKNTELNRAVIFRAAEELPRAATVEVIFPRGLPSAEGNLTTNEAQIFRFRTFGDLKLLKAECGFKNVCAPDDSFEFTFSNQINDKKFDRKMVTVSPDNDHFQTVIYGDRLYIHGAKKGRTTYTVTISGEIEDVFGQKLGAEVTRKFTTSKAEASLNFSGEGLITLDPFAKTEFAVFTREISTAQIKLYQVTPNDWDAFSKLYRRRWNNENNNAAVNFGRLVSNFALRIKNVPNEMVETPIDLSAALKNGFGHVVLEINSATGENRTNERSLVWIQATQIGLTAFVDNEELVAYVSELKNGKPISNADVWIFPNGAKSVSENQTENSAENNLADNKDSGENGWFNWVSSFFGSENAAQTREKNNNGIVRLPLPDAQTKSQNLLVARRGADVAILPSSVEYWYDEEQMRGEWFKKYSPDSLEWFVFDDRKIYKPQEEVAVKGYIRVRKGGKFGDLAQLGDAASGINYVVTDARGNEFARGTANLNAFGAFDFKFKSNDKVNLGNAAIQISTASNLANSTHYHRFQILEFRRPEYEVTAKNETDASYFIKESAKVSVEAKYFAGGALPNAETKWQVTSTPTNYTPPNRDDYTFGKWFPWWRSYGAEYGLRTVQNFEGVTGADGKHILQIDFDEANPLRPYSVEASAAVQDVNRQVWAAKTNLLVHPSAVYVGLKTEKYFVRQNEKISLNVIATDIDGNLLANRNVSVEAELKNYVQEKGEWIEKTVETHKCDVLTKSDAPSLCEFTAAKGGRWEIKSRVFDDRERPNETTLTIYVAGEQTAPPSRTVSLENIQLIPNKKEYAAGETAEILVNAPFYPAEGVITYGREGILKTERFSVNEPSKIVQIKLDEQFLPNITIQVDLVGANSRDDESAETNAEKLPPRPAYASGEIELKISKATRRLSVSAEPLAKNVMPGSKTAVNLEVKDANGQAVSNSEVAVVVVDESILALSSYKMEDPLSIFYTDREKGFNTLHSRENIVLANILTSKSGSGHGIGSGVGSGGSAGGAAVNEKTKSMTLRRAEMAPAPMAAMMSADAEMYSGEEKSAANNEPIKQRENFDALAVFAPSVRTDANGRATVEVQLPDSLTRYRVTAVAVDNSGKRFGTSESNITARQPLMVRPSAPRFMNFGDKVELPVVIQNQTDEPLTVDVAVRAENAELTNGNGRRLTIAANDRAEVRFPVAAVKAGTARFQIAAASGKFSDAAQIELPVWTPATSEAFATYGTTDQNGAIIQPVTAPQNVFPQFGGLEITTSSTQLQELTDAFIQLQRYPFDCSEQIASRMISTAALRDVLRAFKAKDMPTEAEIKAQFARDIEKLGTRQRDDGSFGLWRRNGERYNFPFVSAHAAHALVRAKQKGYQVPDAMLAKSLTYLQNIEKDFDKNYDARTRQTISAYALYIRNLAGANDAAKAKKVLAQNKLENTPFEAIGWLLSVLADGKASAPVEVEQIKRFLMNRTTETSAAAHFVTDYGDRGFYVMASNRRADGVLLESLIKTDEQNDLIFKLVRGLLDNRVAGHWGSTQENVFILLALDKYFATFEKVTPDFVSRIWLGNVYAGEQTFKGRSTDSNFVSVPMKYLLEQGGTSNLIVDKQGAGRLYYRIGLKYAPTNLKLAAADYGFAVTRTYEAVDNAEDVTREADGTWTIKAGARVRVKLQMVAPARRSHVALVDPLPAGLEAVNPALAVSETSAANLPSDVPMLSVTKYRRTWTWFDHQNLRDERAEAFAAQVYGGVYGYEYVTRATTPGEFVVPPAKAEEMYHPETFGRSATDFVKVR